MLLMMIGGVVFLSQTHSGLHVVFSRLLFLAFSSSPATFLLHHHLRLATRVILYWLLWSTLLFPLVVEGARKKNVLTGWPGDRSGERWMDRGPVSAPYFVWPKDEVNGYEILSMEKRGPRRFKEMMRNVDGVFRWPSSMLCYSGRKERSFLGRDVGIFIEN